jgi:hypothetical protein
MKFKGLVIGHNGMWVIDEKSISFHLIRNGFLWNIIDGIRLFPQNKKICKSTGNTVLFCKMELKVHSM